MSHEWNNEKESLLRFWKEEANVHIWLSNKASGFYNFLNRLISIPCILISAVSSTTILSNIYQDDCNLSDEISNSEIDTPTDLNTGLLIVGCFLALGTFLQSLKEFLNLDSKISKFDNNIKTNRLLILDIEEQIYLERSERECPNKLIKRIKEIKKNLVTNTPIIPGFIKKQLKKAIERNEVLDIMSKSILYSYLKNQTIDIDGSMFSNIEPFNEQSRLQTNLVNDNQNQTNNNNNNNNNNKNKYIRDYQSINNDDILGINFSTTSSNSNSNLQSSNHIINISSSDITNFDSNKNVREKILTNLHCL